MRLATSHHSAKFLIDHPDLIFRVEKGSIDLFAIELVDGLPHGRHLFLRDCKEGELLFGVHPSSDYALGVVAGPGTELSSFTPDALTQHVALLETGLNQWMLTLFSRFEPIEIGVTHVDLKMAVEEKNGSPLYKRLEERVVNGVEKRLPFFLLYRHFEIDMSHTDLNGLKTGK